MVKKRIQQIADTCWKIPVSFLKGMQVPLLFFFDEELLDGVLRTEIIDYLAQVSILPSIKEAVIALPNLTRADGISSGMVVATDASDGFIFPFAVGYDINCGLRILRADCTVSDLQSKTKKFADQLFHEIHSTIGHTPSVKIGLNKLDMVLQEGAHRLVKEGFGEEIDTHYIESFGVLENADPKTISQHAKKRGHEQLGTLGDGNHFIQIDYVSEIIDAEAAKAYKLDKGKLIVLIHTGSRDLGHILSVEEFHKVKREMTKYYKKPAPFELTGVPVSSLEGQRYFNAMAACANFAFANRQMLTYELRKVWKDVLGEAGGPLHVLYDHAHNLAKPEYHMVEGRKERLLVHRRGAARAFGPDTPELPADYQPFGQPVVLLSAMGASSYVLKGGGSGQTFSSSSHGVGRVISFTKARKEIIGGDTVEQLAKRGIFVESEMLADVGRDDVTAYKEINPVLRILQASHIAYPVARLDPIIIDKG